MPGAPFDAADPPLVRPFLLPVPGGRSTSLPDALPFAPPAARERRSRRNDTRDTPTRFALGVGHRGRKLVDGGVKWSKVERSGTKVVETARLRRRDRNGEVERVPRNSLPQARRQRTAV